jgi:RNA exonuclease 1
MHSVLNAFFQAPVSGEEKKRRLQERIAGPYPLFNFLLVGNPRLTAKRVGKKYPAQYLLTVEQMIENDYPVPSYLADVFKKPDRWIETPQAANDVASVAETLCH